MSEEKKSELSEDFRVAASFVSRVLPRNADFRAEAKRLGITIAGPMPGQIVKYRSAYDGASKDKYGRISTSDSRTASVEIVEHSADDSGEWRPTANIHF